MASTDRGCRMTPFTDPLAALEEAQFQAEMTGWPQAIVVPSIRIATHRFMLCWTPKLAGDSLGL